MSKVTSFSVPQHYLNPLVDQSPANKSFALVVVTEAFVNSKQCTPEFMARVPQAPVNPKYKCVDIVTVPVRLTEQMAKKVKRWRAIAKKIAPRGSVSALVTAALWWNFNHNVNQEAAA